MYNPSYYEDSREINRKKHLLQIQIQSDEERKGLYGLLRKLYSRSIPTIKFSQNETMYIYSDEFLKQAEEIQIHIDFRTKQIIAGITK